MQLSMEKRILLIDDDLIFSKIVSKVAREAGINLTTINSIRAWDWVTYNKYDVCLVDYDLGNITGVQLIQSLENEHGLLRIPAILVSSYLKPERNWPKSIIDFIHKSAGPQRILTSALLATNLRQSMALRLVQ